MKTVRLPCVTLYLLQMMDSRYHRCYSGYGKNNRGFTAKREKRICFSQKPSSTLLLRQGVPLYPRVYSRQDATLTTPLHVVLRFRSEVTHRNPLYITSCHRHGRFLKWDFPFTFSECSILKQDRNIMESYKMLHNANTIVVNDDVYMASPGSTDRTEAHSSSPFIFNKTDAPYANIFKNYMSLGVCCGSLFRKSNALAGSVTSPAH